ncbi:hypothetical protein M885DRAFT_576621 [Pelagophyceae sp. CCMP2097]|nr:hypothetical protein M885DRAFT_576621 [Pelagophyceae sp. CCMP2097]
MADAPDYDHDAADTDELPLFANDEAKHVFAQIELQRKALEKAAVEHAEHLERLKVMAEHLKNVQQEVSHTTSLATSKTAAIKTEAHGIALFQREAGRYRQELKREQGALELHDAQLQVLQNGVFEANERMDRFKIEMNWNQEELEQWALASKQKEDDDAALQRYTRADEAKVGSLALNIEKLSKLALAKQIACDAEKTETAARQIELERTADEFRALHAERSRLLRQWQDAIDAASRRDRDIGDVAGAYLEERKVKEAKLVQMNDERAALKAAQDATADLESRALLSERQVQMRREDVQREKAQLQTMQDDMDVLKSELASSARAVLRVRSENERSAEEVARRGATLDGARAAYHVSKQQFDFVTAGSGAVENEATAAELFLREAEAAKLSSLRQLAGLKANMFKASQNLFALRQAEANFIAEIGGASAQQRNLAAKVRQLDGESAKQTELEDAVASKGPSLF